MVVQGQRGGQNLSDAADAPAHWLRGAGCQVWWAVRAGGTAALCPPCSVTM
jgi:hypothetical protein